MKDDEEGHVGRVREGQVGMVTLDGVNEVGDIESDERLETNVDMLDTPRISQNKSI